MAITLLDNFNRADGALGSNWSSVSGVSGQPVIASNAVRLDVSGETSALWTADQFSSDQGASMKVVTVPPSFGAHIYFWLCTVPSPTAVTGYILDLTFVGGTGSSGFHIQLYRANAGSFTDLTGDVTATTITNGDVIELTKDDDTFVFSINGTPLNVSGWPSSGIVDPSPLTSPAYAGIGGRADTVMRIDDFSAGDLSTVVNGSATMSLTDTFTSNGIKQRFGSSTVSITDTITSNGHAVKHGSSTTTITDTITSVGAVASFGTSHVDLDVTFTSESTITAYGESTLPLVVTITSRAKASGLDLEPADTNDLPLNPFFDPLSLNLVPND